VISVQLNRGLEKNNKDAGYPQISDKEPKIANLGEKWNDLAQRYNKSIYNFFYNKILIHLFSIKCDKGKLFIKFVQSN